MIMWHFFLIHYLHMWHATQTLTVKIDQKDYYCKGAKS